MKKVEGHSSLMKDINTGTVINTNVKEIENARARKKAKQNKKIEEERMNKRIDDLTDSVTRLESMFRQLLEKEYGNSNR